MRSTTEFSTLLTLMSGLQFTTLLSHEEKLRVGGAAVAEFNGRVNDPVYETAALALLERLSAPPEPTTPAPEEVAPAQAKRAASPKAKAAA